MTDASRAVALLPWGDVVDDWIAPLGLSAESLGRQLPSGLWMLGLARALASVGVEMVIVWFSSSVDEPLRFRHEQTGVRMTVLPSSAAFRFARAHMPSEHLGSRVHPRRVARAGLWYAARYLATPMLTLRAALRRERCGAILCQEYEYQRFDMCIALRRIIGLPVFGVFEGSRAQTRLDPRVRSWSVPRAAGLVIGSSAEASRVQRRYGVDEARIGRISNAIDLDAWRPVDRMRARAALGIPADAAVLAWHGRVEIDIKGLDLLVDATRQVAAARPNRDVRLLIVGTGLDAARLRELLPPTAVWVDEFVSDTMRLREYLCAADVYAFPSRSEGFPIAPLEAMACGLPVVAADVLGVGDIFEHGEDSGGIVIAHRADDLAEALGRVLDDDGLRERLGRRARDRVHGLASFEQVGRRLRDFLAARGAPLSPDGGR
jgi:glycosyltransferase involved in cell wall biosynthesis